MCRYCDEPGWMEEEYISVEPPPPHCCCGHGYHHGGSPPRPYGHWHGHHGGHHGRHPDRQEYSCGRHHGEHEQRIHRWPPPPPPPPHPHHRHRPPVWQAPPHPHPHYGYEGSQWSPPPPPHHRHHQHDPHDYDEEFFYGPAPGDFVPEEEIEILREYSLQLEETLKEVYRQIGELEEKIGKQADPGKKKEE